MENLNILIVDDEPDFRLLLVEALESLGYEAQGAENGDAALDMVKQRHFAVIFTDLNMPGGLSGLDLIRAIHGVDPKTFCILMTGFATTEAAIQALKEGAYDFVQKPFKLAEMEASLNRALDHYKSLRENEAYQSKLEEMVLERTQETVKLKDDIERLFEGFVQASVLAIEARDPSTSGHSSRVADLTVALAETVNRTPNGPYGDIFFSDQQIREIRYAGLLHDFGKVGVREQVLVKAKKLEAERLERILQRLHQRDLEEVIGLMEAAWRRGDPFDPTAFQRMLEQKREESRKVADLVLRCNEPQVLPEEVVIAVGELEELKFQHWLGDPTRIMEPEDLLALRIPKGSLSDAERDEINSHVTHTYRFLSQIPWTGPLANIPDIAYAHHERLNGTGYPRRLRSEQIPLQSKLMAISDVYDALVAADRPYKVAVTVPRSLEILADEVKGGLLDPNLFKLFLDSRIYEITTSRFKV